MARLTRRASSEVRFVLGVAALAAQPCVYFIIEMLKDDRWPRRPDGLHTGVADHLAALAVMP